MEIELTIERLGIYGEGVGRHEGITVFVDGALPGEMVRARIYEKRKNFVRAKPTQYLCVSPHRVTPPCPLFGTCGGCQIMHLEYEEQLKAKRQYLIDALQRIGKFDAPNVMPCIASPSPFSYRNKIQLPVTPDGKLGLYGRGTHTIIPIERCLIHCELGERALHCVQELLSSRQDIDFFRHVLIKTAVYNREVLVIFVTGERSLEEIPEKLMTALPEIKGVIHNINTEVGNVVLSSHFQTLAGRGWVEERLGGLRLKVSAGSFFQVNPLQAERLYQKVIELAATDATTTVLDAYCGVGALSLMLARGAKEVIGIECVPQAIADANENAALNKVSNARFLCGKAEEISLQPCDVAILNPPRKGCERPLLEKLARLLPARIVYISCDPATLARDLQLLCNHGYALDTIQPFDMFAQTTHVETVVLLSRRLKRIEELSILL